MHDLLQSFEERFPVSSRDDTRKPHHLNDQDSALTKLFDRFSGCLLGGGIFRVHSYEDCLSWSSTLGDIWADTKGAVFCFGSNWMGQQFATISSANDSSGICLFDSGAGEVLLVASSIEDMLRQMTTDDDQDNLCLVPEFFDRWLGSGGRAPKLLECVGYKRPLFLGGVDDIENLEISDLDVYWSINGELIKRIQSR